MSYKLDSRVIGQTIKSLRLSRHWTQDFLADVVGYSVRNLRRIENDGTSSIDIVNTFAEVFKISAIDILSGGCFILYKKLRLFIVVPGVYNGSAIFFVFFSILLSSSRIFMNLYIGQFSISSFLLQPLMKASSEYPLT